MNIRKTWLFILLFSLSLNFCGESAQSHVDDDAVVIHKHLVQTAESSNYTVLCDSCHNCHVKIVSDDLDSEIPHIHLTKPRFEQQNSLIVSNTTQLLKPPIS